MKLVTVLMLSALPLYCYAGAGCKHLEEIIESTIDPKVPLQEYLEIIRPFAHNKLTENAAGQFKQCFLKQSNETLANVQRLMVKRELRMITPIYMSRDVNNSVLKE